MKNNKPFKRAFCFLTVCAMMAAATGCSGNTTSSSSQSTASGSSNQASTSSGSGSSSTSSSSSSTAPSSTSTSDAIGFSVKIVPPLETPLAKYPVENGGKVSMWIGFNGTSAKYYQSLAEDLSVKRFVKDTGIQVEFVHPASGQEKENFNLLVVSDSLPDIVVNGHAYYSGGSPAAVSDGVFADLTELIPQNAPDYNYFLENNDLFWRLATTNDGKMYNVYNYKDIQAPYYTRSQFRQDWLDEWKMEIPTTFAKYEEYFKKVKETYPDMAPYTMIKSGIELQFMAAFDIATVDNGKRFFVKDGKIHHSFNEAALKDYLTLMNDWYSKGYINKDFTTVENVEKEFGNGRTGFIVGNSDTVFTLAQELKFSPVTGPYPRVNEGDAYHGDIFYFPQNGTPSSISAKSKNKELALQFLNYGFTKQGSGVINYGDPDTSWKWSESVAEAYSATIPEYTDYALKNPDFPMSDIEYTVRLHTCWSKYRYGDDVSMIRNVANPECWNYRAKWGDDETSDNSYALPDLNFSPEIATEIGTLTTNIDTYAEEMCLKFITGAAPLSDFDQFSAQVKTLGIDRLIEIYQNAYDELLAKKR